ncbi:MAG: endonuclease/exonuclease/phosphatase family protein [Bacteroidales bacterium]|nr:endonuclease/exonuclease/phosphatase family protein [Bacteroidales bacterium]
MRRILFTLALAFAALTTLTSFTTGQHQQPKRYALYGVAFYNLENLFDTLHDAGKNDYEYLPSGTNKWGKMKYEAKLHNMARVLSELCTDKLPQGPAVIGVSELENHLALEDLLNQPSLAGRGLKYVDVAGPDRRGVECAFIYNPRFFQMERYMHVPYYYAPSGRVDDPLVGFYTDEQGEVQAYTDLKGDTTHITRGFLVMQGLLAGERMFFIVNHWPSRAAGSEARERAGHQVRMLKDALMASHPEAKVMIMGDMNDDPADKSMTTALGCKPQADKVKKTTDLFNPWHETLYKRGQGTLLYQGKWNLFDQIVFSGNLLGTDRTSLKFYKHEIFMRDYLFQQEGKYKGSPLRTHAGGVWLNGYSDHLPTYVYLIKEVR